MPNGTVSISISAAGVSIQKSFVRNGNTALSLEVTLPVAQAGTLTTRTDADTGEITMSSGAHTIATSDVVDIHWSGGVRYGVTVGTVAGTAVPFDLGAGDDLPSTSTAVTVAVQVDTNIALDGDNANLVAVLMDDAAGGSAAGHVDFQDSGDASIAELDLVANVPQTYDLASGIANPFTGNPITHCVATNASTTAAATLKVVALIDN